MPPTARLEGNRCCEGVAIMLVVEATRFGGPQVLVPHEVPDPVAGPGSPAGSTTAPARPGPPRRPMTRAPGPNCGGAAWRSPAMLISAHQHDGPHPGYAGSPLPASSG